MTMTCLDAAIDPLVIPIRNASFSGNTTTGHSWISISLGEPPQLRSFKLSTLDDALSVANPSACVNGNDDAPCVAELGGLYEPEHSTTYHEVPESQWNSSHEPNTRNPALWFYENIQIAGKTLPEYPMLQYAGKTRYANILGISNSSQFIATAESSGLAPSRAWGLWVGNSNTDGSLVIGGYDQARISGKFATFNIKSSSLSVQLKSIEYNAPNGSTVTLLSEPGGQWLRLSPEDSDLQVSPDAFDIFVRATGATNYSSLGRWGWPAETQLGNVTIGFLNNYEVTLPAHDLWQPFSGYDSTRGMSVYNDSILVSQIRKRTDKQYNFGLPFFKSVYMRCFPDENYFDLATVKPEPGVQTIIQSFCTTDTTVTTNATGGQMSSSKSSRPTGVIAGGVVGGFAALLLGLLLLGVGLRRRRRRRGATWQRPIIPELMASTQAPARFEFTDPVRYEVQG